MADTSAWNRSTAVEPVWAALLEANAIGICAPVRLELLYSARGRADFAALRRDLLALPELTLDERAVTLAEQTQASLGAVSQHRGPTPFDLLVALRLMCRETLILRTSTVPEVPSVRNMAVYWPLLSARQRRPWSHHRLGTGTQIGITTPFDVDAGYGNWFWGLTPSCLAALLETAGFRPVYRATEPWVQPANGSVLVLVIPRGSKRRDRT